MSPPFGVEFHHSANNRYAEDTPDDEWLAEVGAKNWIVFSHDRKFHEELAAISAIKQHSIGCFYLWGAEITAWEKLRFFVRVADRIAVTAKATSKPFIFHVAQRGKITRVDIP